MVPARESTPTWPILTRRRHRKSERQRGLEPRLCLLGRQVPYLLGDYRAVVLIMRRPCGARTRHLLIENQVSYQLLQRSLIVRALPRIELQTRGLQPRALPLTSRGHGQAPALRGA